jgi:hypothetical protein
MAWWSRSRRAAGAPPDGVALVTACFGGIDAVKPLPPHDGIDAFYYTDAAGAASADPDCARTWTRVVVPDYPRHDFGPRLRGRYFKHQIHRLDEVRGHRWLVWADSSVRFKDLGFVHRAVAELLRRPPLERVLLVPHPERRTISEEFRFIQDAIDGGDPYLRLRYASEKMPEQMAYFRSRGWDLEAPLWCGTVWMIENSEAVRRAFDAWWDQNLRYGLMDQLSLPVILADHGITPTPLDVRLWDNPYFTWISHQREM